MSNMKYERIPVNCTADIGTAKLDLAAPTDLFYGNIESPQALTNWKGVYNVSRGMMATVVSKDYQIIQDSWTQEAVTQALTNLNLDVKGVIKKKDNSFIMDVVFQNQGAPVKDDAEGIEIGFRLTNSYDKTSGFRLEMFGFRKVCQNGMTFGERSFGVYESTIHYGTKEKNVNEICVKTQMFIKEVINSSSKMQAYVNAMMEDSLEYDSCIKIIRALVKTKKHIEPMIERLESAKTRWDLYNVFTSYATHDLQLTPQLQSVFEAKSRKIMETGSEGLTLMADKILAKVEVEVE